MGYVYEFIILQMDWPANQSNDFNSEAPADPLPNLWQRRSKMDWLANQSNDFTSKAPADPLPNLRQRRPKMDWLANQSNDFNSEAPANSLPNLWQRQPKMDWLANQSNDFNSEAPADSLPNLWQPQPKQKVVIKLSMGNKEAQDAAMRVPGVTSARIDGDIIEVMGNDIDSDALTTIMRNKLGHADLRSVTHI
ncbi:uncharacterized protein LOC144546603 [Carex rostrata]